MDKKTISRDELKQMMDELKFFTLVDVRNREAYFAEHIPGAITLPLEEIEQKAHNLFFRDEKIIVYGEQDGEGDRKAQEMLISMGFPNILVYERGLADWKEAGLEIETGVGEQTKKVSGTAKEETTERRGSK